MRTLKLLCAFLIVYGCLPSAHAEVVNWTVRGTVLYFSATTAAIPYQIASGDEFVLTLTVDAWLFAAGHTSEVGATYARRRGPLHRRSALLGATSPPLNGNCA